MEVYVLDIFLFICGMWAGKILTDMKWRHNSKVPMRIASGKRLYKVILEEDFR